MTFSWNQCFLLRILPPFFGIWLIYDEKMLWHMFSMATGQYSLGLHSAHQSRDCVRQLGIPSCRTIPSCCTTNAMNINFLLLPFMIHPNRWWMAPPKSICYLLFYFFHQFRVSVILSKITCSRYRYNVVQYSMILHTALQWMRQTINKKQFES